MQNHTVDLMVVGGEALFDIFTATMPTTPTTPTEQPSNAPSGADIPKREHVNQRGASKKATQPATGGMTLHAYPGGSPFNVTIGLARLGAPVAFAAALSTDWLGDSLEAVLQREGVNMTWLQRLHRPTTISFVGRTNDGQPVYAFYAHESADQSLASVKIPKDLEDKTMFPRAFHAGSIAAAMGRSAEAYLAFAEKCRRMSEHTVVSYDPNVRPTVEPNLDIWRRQFERWCQVADILKISQEDLHTLWPDADIASHVAQWMKKGVTLVVVTNGAKGAQAFWKRSSHSVGAAPVANFVDSVGAGDTFQAGLLAGIRELNLLNRSSLRELSTSDVHRVLTLASGAAAIVVGRQGANPPQRNELPPI